MGTRSIIRFQTKGERETSTLLTVYQRYDGYISGIGHDLARYINGMRFCNGFGMDRTLHHLANGFDCFVAQFVARFKTQTGDLYIVNKDTENEDYNYYVVFDSNAYYKGESDPNKLITITVTNFDNEKPIFVGTPEELMAFNE